MHTHPRTGLRVLVALLFLLSLCPVVSALGNSSQQTWQPLLPSSLISATAADSCSCFPFLGARALMLTHGSPLDSPFWKLVQAGFFEGAKRVNAAVEGHFLTAVQVKEAFGGSPALGMVTLLEEQFAHYSSSPPFPQLLIVSLPDALVMQHSIEKWLDVGVNLITFNGDSADSRAIGATYHLSSDEELSGFQTGVRLASSGVIHTVCMTPR
jgi:hypothetical protein